MPFLSPYNASKLLDGVIPANKTARPNFLQTKFARRWKTVKDTINFDKEFETKNTPAMYVAPRVDAPLLRLQGFGSQFLEFAYVKEGIRDPDFEELNARQLGQQFGQVDIMANWKASIQKQLALSEAHFENLFELNASKILFTSGYTAESPLHPKVLYDFNRTIITEDAGYLAGYIPEIDLTTLVGNGGAGKRAWDVTDGTVLSTPYKDVIKACNTTLRRGPIDSIVMAEDAYELLEADILTNYKSASDLTLAVMTRVEQKILPEVEKFEDLNFQRMLPLGSGKAVAIYTYTAVTHDRITGIASKYVPEGHFVVIPSPEKGIKVYSRILHPGAKYEARERFINTWQDPKSGLQESEIHMNVLMGHTDIDSVSCWKVAG